MRERVRARGKQVHADVVRAFQQLLRLHVQVLDCLRDRFVHAGDHFHGVGQELADDLVARVHLVHPRNQFGGARNQVAGFGVDEGDFPLNTDGRCGTREVHCGPLEDM